MAVDARMAAAALAVAAVTGLLAPAAAAQSASSTVCEAVNGTLVPVCNAAICNQGNVTGDLRGRFNTRITSIYPSGASWLYTAWLRIELEGAQGVVDLAREGVAPRDAEGGPDLGKGTEVLTISESTTGAYQDFSGTLVTTGAHAAGLPAQFTGRICHTRRFPVPSSPR